MYIICCIQLIHVCFALLCFSIYIYCYYGSVVVSVIGSSGGCWCVGLYFLSLVLQFLEIIIKKKKQLVFKTSNCTADAVIPFVLAHDPATAADHSNVVQSSKVLMSPFVVC